MNVLRMSQWVFSLTAAVLLSINIAYAGGDDCVTVASGNWSDPTIWDCTGSAVVPGNFDFVTISSGDTVTLDIDATVNSLVVAAGGDLDVAASPSGLTLAWDEPGGDLSEAQIDLAGDLTINVSNVDLIIGSVNGAFNLSLNNNAVTRITGQIGGSTPLASITTDAAGSTAIDISAGASQIDTSGDQVYNDALTVRRGSRVVSSTANIIFNGTLDESTSGGGQLIVTAASTIQFNDRVGSNNPLFAMQMTGAGIAEVNTDMVIVNELHRYGLPVIIGESSQFSGSPVNFDNTVNDDGDGATGSTVTINTDMSTINSVGATSPIDRLITDAAGSTTVNGNITTVMNQTFNDPVILGGDVVFTGSNGNFPAGLDAQNNNVTYTYTSDIFLPGNLNFSNVNDLTIGTGAGSTRLIADITVAGTQTYNSTLVYSDLFTLTANNLIFNGAVTATDDLPIRGGGGGPAGLILNTTNEGVTAFNQSINNDLLVDYSITTNADGMTQLGANISAGNFTFNDPVVLTDDVTRNTSFMDLTVLFNSTLDAAGNFGLLTSAPFGTYIFNAPVGATGPLAFLTLNTTNITVSANITTSGEQTYGNLASVTQTANVAYTGAGITFTGPLNADSAAANRTIVLDSPVIALAEVGATASFQGLTTTAGGTTAIEGDIVINGQAAFNNNVTTTTGFVLTNNANGPVQFAGTLINPAATVADVTINNAGNTVFNRSVLGINNLTTDAAGVTLIGLAVRGGLPVAQVIVGNLLSFNDPVQLLGEADFGANFFNFGQGLNADGNDLELITRFFVQLPQAIALSNVNNLTINGSGGIGFTDSITTLGSQTYAVPTFVVNPTNLTATTVTFETPPLSDDALAQGNLTITGNAVFRNTLVRQIQFGDPPDDLDSLVVTGNTELNLLGGTLTTSGLQDYQGDTTLVSDATLSSTGNGNISLRDVLGAGMNLTTSTGGETSFTDNTFGQPVIVQLASLTTGSAGNTRFAFQLDLQLDGDTATTFNNELRLGPSCNCVINQSGAGDIIFNDPVVLTSGSPHRLTVNDVSGRTIFNDLVNLGQLTTNDGSGTDSTVINTDSITTSIGGANNGAMTFNDPVVLSAAATTFTGNNNASVTFNNVIDASGFLGDPGALTINTAGITTIAGEVGGQLAPSSLITDAEGQTVVSADITTRGRITFADPLIIGAATALVSQFIEPIQIASMDDDGDSATSSAVLLDAGSNSQVILGETGAAAAIDSLVVESEVAISGDITTIGNQIYNDDLLIGVDTILMADAVTVSANIDSADKAPSSLTIETTGQTSLIGDIGAVAPLTTLAIQGKGNLLFDAAVVTTSGSQSYSQPIELVTASQISAGFVDISNTLALNDDDLTITTSSDGSIINGVISGSGELTKTGTGDLLLSAANTHTGNLNHQGGMLFLNGSADSIINVTTAATLAGTGVANNTVTISGGELSPGMSSGILSTGNLFLDSSANFLAEINGLFAGTEHDQLQVSGAVELVDATLELDGGYISIGQLDVITLIVNDGNDPVVGTFTGLPEGATVNLNGPLTISYMGGDGNDVVLIDDEGVFFDGFEETIITD